MPGRAEERAGFDASVRLRLVEADMDRADARFSALEEKLADGMEAVDSRLGKIMWAVVGLLISVSTTCIVLVITLGLGS